MTTHLDRLKSAEHKLHTLRLHVPTLEAAFNHRLCKTFPRLPQDSRTEGLHINHEALPEPGQSPVLVSKTLSSQIEGSFLAQTPPSKCRFFAIVSVVLAALVQNRWYLQRKTAIFTL